MSGTIWTSEDAGFDPRIETPGVGIVATLAGCWERAVAARLHRALDTALRAGELRELGSGTLADIGYRRD
jgi:hypothetical protein